MAKQVISVLITDLDNTLFDWFEFWYHSFSALFERLVLDSGIPPETLLSEIKKVHEKYQTSEYAFLIEELPSLQAKHPHQNLADIYNEAIHEYRKARLKHLKMYPGVMDTLQTVKEAGCLIVAFTESMGFYTADRIRRLELDGVIDLLYSPEDHDFTGEHVAIEQLRKYPAEYYQLKRTQHRHTPRGELKPSSKVLLKIVNDIGTPPENIIYVGDSLFKDVKMAKDAGIKDVYAQYGKAHTKQEYELLRSVTHWTSEHVNQERLLDESAVKPSHVLDGGFSQLLALFQFTRYTGSLVPPPNDRLEHIIDIWEKTVDVQQHFNDLGMRIRTIAVPALGAIVGAAALTLKEGFSITVLGLNFSAAFFIIIGAIVMWIGFWLMDRHWYHRLLYGAVKHGEKIEEALQGVLPEISLTKQISQASPISALGMKIHSTAKINIFYGLGFILLLVLLAVFYFGKTPPPKPTEPTKLPETAKPTEPTKSPDPVKPTEPTKSGDPVKPTG